MGRGGGREREGGGREEGAGFAGTPPAGALPEDALPSLPADAPPAGTLPGTLPKDAPPSPPRAPAPATSAPSGPAPELSSSNAEALPLPAAARLSPPAGTPSEAAPSSLPADTPPAKISTEGAPPSPPREPAPAASAPRGLASEFSSTNLEALPLPSAARLSPPAGTLPEAAPSSLPADAPPAKTSTEGALPEPPRAPAPAASAPSGAVEELSSTNLKDLPLPLPVAARLSLPALSTSPFAASTVANLQQPPSSSSPPPSLSSFTLSSLPNSPPVLPGATLMATAVWPLALSSPTRVLWLADLVGDSFSRGQYGHLCDLLRRRAGEKGGARAAEKDEDYGVFKETYHLDHVFCCPAEEGGRCTLALSTITGNFTDVAEQVERQGKELLRQSPPPPAGSAASAAEAAAVCVSWKWSKYSSEAKVLKRLEEHRVSKVWPMSVVLTHGLHCAMRQDWKKKCSRDRMAEIGAVLARLASERGVVSAVDTASFVAPFAPKGKDPERTNRRSALLNAATAEAFGAVEGVWVRDVRAWSELFHSQNRNCIADDGVHVTCGLFREVYVGWFLNLVLGEVEVCGEGGAARQELCGRREEGEGEGEEK